MNIVVGKSCLGGLWVGTGYSADLRRSYVAEDTVRLAHITAILTGWVIPILTDCVTSPQTG